MVNNNITPVTSTIPSIKAQGAVIRSTAHLQDHRVHYGVQSATFTRTVFPGQAAGTYRVNSIIPTWQSPQYIAQPGTVSSYRSAGAPPIPYPPRNASAYYSEPLTRIIPNPCYACFKAFG
jgi:hypothetical protein